LSFTTTIDQVDLAEARAAIDKANRAILFLMFNPGRPDTLLNHIIDIAHKPPAAQRRALTGGTAWSSA
jgi:hypothetical protein